jgi:serine/threonine protein kinase/tetratricopeptide (TPR) repeat protein
MLQPPNIADSSTYGAPVDPIAPLRAALRGHYEIEREIGQGAFATVYLARDLKHERKVAIKVLNADPTSEMGELRFIREIRLLARLQHPNILPLHDSGHVEALLYYVMPYVRGDTLRDRIHRERQLPIESACAITKDVADALSYAHAQGIVHRDIKPENILLSTDHPIIADFGIARAIDVAGVRQLTRTGAQSPGTPAYMSPEQLLGDRELDGRSDIYSLGCVFFEMLTGKPPFAGKDGFVKRFTEPAPRASSIRKDLPAPLDGVLERALRREPEDRYPTAKEFVEALCATDARETSAVPTSISNRQERPGSVSSALAQMRSHPRLTTAVFLGLAATTISLGVAANPKRIFGRTAQLDSARIVVLPFNAPNSMGGRVAENLYDQMSEWQGLHLVPDTRVAQAIKESAVPSTEQEAVGMGKRLGAGKVVWGTVSAVGNGARVGVHLYNVSSGESTDDFVFDESSKPETDAAARRLIGIRNRPAEGEGCDIGTRSFPAWTACGRGHRALKEWDIAGAEREFRAAIAADPDYTTPRLWLAQILSWQGFSTLREWRDQVARAVVQEAALSARDRTLAVALNALASGRFPDACDSYLSLTSANPRDFVALYGLGQCQEMDSLVIASRVSPSGVRFRSSYDAAAKYYVRALRLEPGAHVLLAFERLQRLLPTATGQIRIGFGLPPARQLYAAYPELSGDTIAFTPYSPNAFARITPGAPRREALDRNSDLLLDFVMSWTQQASADPTAFEALADLLETRGDLADTSGTGPSALAAIERAAALAHDPEQRIRVRAREVSIRFKRSEFAVARSLADSVLAEASRSGRGDPRVLGGLAALTGKLARATQLARLSDAHVPVTRLSIPSRVGGPAAAFFTYAALGVCGPQIDRIERELDTEISSSFAEADQPQARVDLKTRPLGMSAPCNNATASLKIPASQDEILRMQQALAHGNHKGLRAMLDSTAVATRTQRPADLSVDYTYQLGWLRAALGDTAAAIKNLDIALGALPSLSSGSLRDIAPAAAAVRAMALRAELAIATDDPTVARRWAGAVATLWRDADPQLQPFVERMRDIARGSKQKEN